MKSALLTLLTLVGLVLLVEFLGRPVRGEPLADILFHPDPELPAGTSRVIGHVVTKSGRPVDDLRVVATEPNPVQRLRYVRWNGPSSVLSETRTDAHGRFVLDLDRLEPVRIWAGSERFLWGMTHPVALRAGHLSRGVLVTVERRPQTTR